MKLEGFVASMRSAESVEDLFNILSKRGAPIVDIDGERFLIIIEGDFEGSKFWTEINGDRANNAIGDAILTSASFPFKCKKPYTGGNVIFVPMKDVESEEFLVAYVSEREGSFYRVKGERFESISREEYEALRSKMPRFVVRGMSEEQMENMGAFFG